jgi:hypothetical protein
MTDVTEMIRAGVMAGRYRSEARATPRLRRGWLRMAALHSRKAAALGARIAQGCQLDSKAAVAQQDHSRGAK